MPKSPPMPAEFEVTFDQPGTYGYFCIPHEGSNMTGSVWVEE